MAPTTNRRKMVLKMKMAVGWISWGGDDPKQMGPGQNQSTTGQGSRVIKSEEEKSGPRRMGEGG